MTTALAFAARWPQIELDTLLVEPVKRVSRCRIMFPDRRKDFFPAHSTDVDSTQRRPKPIGEPLISCPTILLHSSFNLGLYRAGIHFLESASCDLRVGGEHTKAKISYMLGTAIRALEDLSDAGNGSSGLIKVLGIRDALRKPAEHLGFDNYQACGVRQ